MHIHLGYVIFYAAGVATPSLYRKFVAYIVAREIAKAQAVAAKARAEFERIKEAI